MRAAGANQAVAAAQSGADVRFVGRIGDDGRWLLDELQRRGVNTELVAVDTTEVCTTDASDATLASSTVPHIAVSRPRTCVLPFYPGPRPWSLCLAPLLCDSRPA